jgi:hypothetical protein
MTLLNHQRCRRASDRQGRVKKREEEKMREEKKRKEKKSDRLTGVEVLADRCVVTSSTFVIQQIALVFS